MPSSPFSYLYFIYKSVSQILVMCYIKSETVPSSSNVNSVYMQACKAQISFYREQLFVNKLVLGNLTKLL